MAFGYNSPYGNPYGIDYMNYQTAVQPPYMNPTVPSQGQKSNTFYYVNGIEGAKAFYMPVNSTVLLLDSDGTRYYWKTTDAQGRAEIKVYKCAPETEQDRQPAVEYVTKADFEAYKKEMSVFMKPKTNNNNNTQKDGKQ